MLAQGHKIQVITTERLGRRVQVGAIDEDCQALIRIKIHHLNPL
jgi:hypothetical protein